MKYLIKVTNDGEITFKFPPELVLELGISFRYEKDVILRKMTTLKDGWFLTENIEEPIIIEKRILRAIQVVLIILSILFESPIRTVGILMFSIFTLPKIREFVTECVIVKRIKEERKRVEKRALMEALKKEDENVKFWQVNENRYDNMDIYIVMPIVLLIFGSSIQLTVIFSLVVMIASLFRGFDWYRLLKVEPSKEEIMMAKICFQEFKRSMATDVDRGKHPFQLAEEYNENYKHKPLSVSYVGQKKKKKCSYITTVNSSLPTPEQIMQELEDSREKGDINWEKGVTIRHRAWLKKKKIMKRA